MKELRRLGRGIPLGKYSKLIDAKYADNKIFIASAKEIYMYDSLSSLRYEFTKSSLVPIISIEIMSKIKILCVACSDKTISFFNYQTNEWIDNDIKCKFPVLRLISINTHELLIVCKREVFKYSYIRKKIIRHFFHNNSSKILTSNLQGDLFYQNNNKKIKSLSLNLFAINNEVYEERLYDILQTSRDGRLLAGVKINRKDSIIKWWTCFKLNDVTQINIPSRLSGIANYGKINFLLCDKKNIYVVNPIHPEVFLYKLSIPSEPIFIKSINNEITIIQMKSGDVRAHLLGIHSVDNLIKELKNNFPADIAKDRLKDYSTKYLNKVLYLLATKYEASIILANNEYDILLNKEKYMDESLQAFARLRSIFIEFALLNDDIDNYLSDKFIEIRNSTINRLLSIHRENKY